MRFIVMVKSAENSVAGAPPKALMDAIGKLGQEATQAGAMVETGGLLPTAMGARVRLADGKISLTDGPFTEAKEVIGGYAIYEVPSKREAIEWSRRFLSLHKEHWKGWEGELEIRQLMHQMDYDCGGNPNKT